MMDQPGAKREDGTEPVPRLRVGTVGPPETGWLLGGLTCSIIQMIRQVPSGSDGIDDACNLSSPDSCGADQFDADHQATELAVPGPSGSGDLGESPGEEVLLGGVGGQGERGSVGLGGVMGLAEAAQQVGAGGRQVGVGREVRVAGDLLQGGE